MLRYLAPTDLGASQPEDAILPRHRAGPQYEPAEQSGLVGEIESLLSRVEDLLVRHDPQESS